MARIAENETKLHLAVSRSNSLRTTIPIYIINKLGLEKGDSIVWDLDKNDGRWFAVIEKKKE